MKTVDFYPESKGEKADGGLFSLDSELFGFLNYSARSNKNFTQQPRAKLNSLLYKAPLNQLQQTSALKINPF